MAGLPDSWTRSEETGCPHRELILEGKTKAKSMTLRESILRFPSAPVFETHEARQHAYKVEEQWPNYHTMRVLTRKDLSASGARHVFLLHNGLNETRDISFHYRLASWILKERENAACIIRPLPGHLSRYFFQSPFTEPPLGEYLQDPASLFRQFLRYMLETQWLLSILVPRYDFDVTSGCDLLLNSKRKKRTDADKLGDEIAAQANRALTASNQRSDESDQKDQYSRERLNKLDVRVCVKTLRGILGWKAVSSTKPPSRGLEKPAIHVVGYSMGGFVAQSVFCTWPFAVASCSNLFAGGALRELAPTAFAHQEEWQSVLHGLRSELDHARIQQRLSPAPLTPKSKDLCVVGIEKPVFEYFVRIFEDVFLQSDRGSYSTRLAEFSRRLLFVLGGDDPIVRTQSVLDAAPPGGVNLHQIGDVSHFQDSKHKEPAELEQREFWLPEVGGMIGRFAERAADLLQRTNHRYWRSSPRPASSPDGSGQRKREPDGGLQSMQFERELDSMIEMVKREEGWLFIARGQIPTVFLDPPAFRAHAAAMHHSEDLIGDYAEALEARAKRLKKLGGRFSLLIPSAQVLSDGLTPIKPPDTSRDRAMFAKSEVAIRYWPDEKSRQRAWRHFLTTWCDGAAVRSVKEDEYMPDKLGDVGIGWGRKSGDLSEPIAITVLPDIWVAFDKVACRELLEAKVDPDQDKDQVRQAVEQGMVKLAAKLTEKKSVKADRLQELLTTGAVRVVKVSAAEFNPRYRGRLLDGSSRETGGSNNQLIHWAMAYEASSPVIQRDPAAKAPSSSR
jgi:hypothetical protein